MGSSMSEWKKKFWTAPKSKTQTSDVWLKDSLFMSDTSRYDRHFYDDYDDTNKVTKESTSSWDHYQLAKYLRAIGNFVNILTGNNNIKVKFVSHEVSKTDGRTVTISPKIDEGKFDVTVGLALHEASHIVHTKFNKLKPWIDISTLNLLEKYGDKGDILWDFSYLDDTLRKQIDQLTDSVEKLKFKTQYFVKTIGNIIEDMYVDAYTYKEAPGYRGYYAALYNETLGTDLFTKSLWSDAGKEVTADNYIMHIMGLLTPACNITALPEMDKIYLLINPPDILRLKKQDDRFGIAQLVADIIFSVLYNRSMPPMMPQNGGNQGDDESQPNEKNQSKQNGGGVGGGGNNKPDKDDIDDLIKELANKLSKENGKSDKTSDNNDANLNNQDNDNDYDDENGGDNSGHELTDSQKKKLAKLMQEVAANVNGDHSSLKKGTMNKEDAQLTEHISKSDITLKDINVGAALGLHGNFKPERVFVFGEITPDMLTNGIGATIGITDKFKNTEPVMQGIQAGRVLANKLKLRTESRSLTSTRLKSGKIDKRLLHEIPNDTVNIFSRIQIETYNNSYIHLSLDSSGSMGGTKWNKAIKTAAMIATASTLIPNLRVVVTTRSTFVRGNNYNTPFIATIFDSKKHNIHHIKKIFPACRVAGSTPEGLTFAAIIDDIIKQSANTDAYFINVCDGEPTYTHGVEHTTLQRTKMENHGIKILSYYVDSYHYNNPATLRCSHNFIRMYGEKNSFALPAANIERIASTMNKKLLEK